MSGKAKPYQEHRTKRVAEMYDTLSETLAKINPCIIIGEPHGKGTGILVWFCGPPERTDVDVIECLAKAVLCVAEQESMDELEVLKRIDNRMIADKSDRGMQPFEYVWVDEPQS